MAAGSTMGAPFHPAGPITLTKVPPVSILMIRLSAVPWTM